MKRKTHTPFRTPTIVLYQCPAAVRMAIEARKSLFWRIVDALRGGNP
jgi:hypothetical protein